MRIREWEGVTGRSCPSPSLQPSRSMRRLAACMPRECTCPLEGHQVGAGCGVDGRRGEGGGAISASEEHFNLASAPLLQGSRGAMGVRLSDSLSVGRCTQLANAGRAAARCPGCPARPAPPAGSSGAAHLHTQGAGIEAWLVVGLGIGQVRLDPTGVPGRGSKSRTEAGAGSGMLPAPVPVPSAAGCPPPGTRSFAPSRSTPPRPLLTSSQGPAAHCRAA